MSAAQERSWGPERVERFRPASGRVVGYLSLAVIATVLLHLALDVRSTEGLRLGAGLVFLAVLVWVTQLRPRAVAYPDRLDLRSSLRDVTLPMAAIDEVNVRRTLEVWMGGERFVCIGIGAPLRSMIGTSSRGPSSLLGLDRFEAYTQESTPPGPDRSEMSYADFVEARISALVAEARVRGSRAESSVGRAGSSWAWAEIVALLATGAGFLATLLL